jgi:hypothetical protein
VGVVPSPIVGAIGLHRLVITESDVKFLQESIVKVTCKDQDTVRRGGGSGGDVRV